jgi:hypothetical protein
MPPRPASSAGSSPRRGSSSTGRSRTPSSSPPLACQRQRIEETRHSLSRDPTSRCHRQHRPGSQHEAELSQNGHSTVIVLRPHRRLRPLCSLAADDGGDAERTDAPSDLPVEVLSLCPVHRDVAGEGVEERDVLLGPCSASPRRSVEPGSPRTSHLIAISPSRKHRPPTSNSAAPPGLDRRASHEGQIVNLRLMATDFPQYRLSFDRPE